MIFVKLEISSFFGGGGGNKMGLEVMFDDGVVKEQAHLDKKIVILHSCHTETSLKELTIDFGQKLEISLLFFFSFKKSKKNM